MHDVFTHGLATIGQANLIAANIEQRTEIDLLTRQTMLDQCIGCSTAERGTRIIRTGGQSHSLTGRKSL